MPDIMHKCKLLKSLFSSNETESFSMNVKKANKKTICLYVNKIEFAGRVMCIAYIVRFDLNI